MTVDISDFADFCGTKDLSQLRHMLQKLDPCTLSDKDSLPSLWCGYMRTGDVMFMPLGVLFVEKVVNDMSLGIRRAVPKHNNHIATNRTQITVIM